MLRHIMDLWYDLLILLLLLLLLILLLLLLLLLTSTQDSLGHETAGSFSSIYRIFFLTNNFPEE